MKGTFQLLPIWQTSSEQSEQLIRWDSIYLKPANEHAEKVFRLIEDCLSRVQPIETVLLNEGDTLLVDNWRLLHGRSTVQNPASPRRIHRVYLSYLT
jgi:alpha-ketoglutarate-dependent taurine dioxygenase